jgi:hypothetical protein
MVYLDSSDYSALSDPKRLAEGLTPVQGELVALADGGRVRFAFSATHLSEMAPLEPRYTPPAAGRADMLVRLCRQTALVSFDRLISMETGQLAGRMAAPLPIVTDDATWFPEMKDLVGPVQAADTLRQAIAQVEVGLNHQQRRKFKQEFFRGGQPGPRLWRLLADVGNHGDLSEALALYPMRPQDARALWRYVVGQASAAEADAAFLASLRDPRWMMRWFAQHHGQLSPFLELVRGPARTLIAELSHVVARGRTLAAMNEFPTERWWHDLQDQTVLEQANRFLAQEHPGAPACIDVDQVDERCPGLATAIRLLWLVLRDSLAPQHPRDMQDSDVVDALHAAYAPYVQVFRADRYMAPRIQGLVERCGTTVVAKLTELPAVIERRLANAL